MKLATEEFDRISKALADPRRPEIVQKLVARRMNCSDVHAMFNVSQPTVSHHLKELATAGILDNEKQGQFCFYQVRADVLSAYVTELQRRLGLGAITVAPRIKYQRAYTVSNTFICLRDPYRDMCEYLEPNESVHTLM